LDFGIWILAPGFVTRHSVILINPLFFLTSSSHLNEKVMLRLFALALFLTIGSTAYSQTYSAPESTSATDGEVKLHNSKKSRFHKATRERKSERITEPGRESSKFQATRERKSERITEPVRSSKYKAQARATERHGGSAKNPRRSEARETERHGKSVKDSGYKSEGRQTERHGKAVKKSRGSKRQQVKRAVGRSNF
jgi:hypothetical protein